MPCRRLNAVGKSKIQVAQRSMKCCHCDNCDYCIWLTINHTVVRCRRTSRSYCFSTFHKFHGPSKMQISLTWTTTAPSGKSKIRWFCYFRGVALVSIMLFRRDWSIRMQSCLLVTSRSFPLFFLPRSPRGSSLHYSRLLPAYILYLDFKLTWLLILAY